MLLKNFLKMLDGVKGSEGIPEQGEVWVRVGNCNYLVRSVELDGEGDTVIKVNPTPY